MIAEFPRLPADERNMARRIFLDPDARQVHPDWEGPPAPRSGSRA
ncbi:MmyB family transcriptional regulator [Frankia sp. AiPs1]